MWGKKKAWLVSIPGSNQEIRDVVEEFLHENGIKARVIHMPFEIKELN